MFFYHCHSHPDPTFLDELGQFINCIFFSTIIVGDFNIPHHFSSFLITLSDLLIFFLLTRKYVQPRTRNTLELIISFFTLKSLSLSNLSIALFDHFLFFSYLHRISFTLLSPTWQIFFLFLQLLLFQYKHFFNDFSVILPTTESSFFFDLCLASIIQILSTFFDKPVISKSPFSLPRSTRFNAELLSSKLKMRATERRFWKNCLTTTTRFFLHELTAPQWRHTTPF